MWYRAMANMGLGLVLLVALNNARADSGQARHSLQLAGSAIKISFMPDALVLDQDAIVRQIELSAAAVEKFYGRFPVSKLNIVVNAGAASNQRLHGVTYRGEEPLIMLTLGTAVDAEALARDWVITHEMVHLAFPPVIKRHHWIEEGLATYIEPLARAQAGLQSTAEVWRWLLIGLPKGLPQAGDRGLDNTPTWGRTYWGGALYCFLADIEIRQRTANRFGLQHALRAINAAGGNMQQERVWPLTRALAIGDAAIGVAVLTEVYTRHRETPLAVDLERLWRQLGVSLTADQQGVRFDAAAPLAWLRDALTRPLPP